MMAGTFFHAQINIKAMGIIAQKEIEKLSVNTLTTVSISFKSADVVFIPKIEKRIKDTIKAGIVDHIKCLMCLKRSVPTMAEAKLVDSDKGDILSPKTAPEMIAPATRAGLAFILAPIPKSAIPTVEIVVKPLPIARPTIEQTIKTDGTKN